jgi:hypothetical protein
MNRDEAGNPDLLAIARERFVAELDHWCDQRGFPRNELDDQVVATRPLSSTEAIGSPERDDFPLLRGNEVLMQAAPYRGSLGQAFTSDAGVFSGTLETADRFGCRVVFYGTTIAGAAHLLGLER